MQELLGNAQPVVAIGEPVSGISAVRGGFAGRFQPAFFEIRFLLLLMRLLLTVEVHKAAKDPRRRVFHKLFPAINGVPTYEY
jgi:hypothetical protein